MSNTSLLLKRLVKRGDIISIDQGVLKIIPKSGTSIPNKWWNDNREKLINEIITLTNTNAFVYQNYTTGRYSSHKAEGATLQFENILQKTPFYTIFNVYLTRSRNTTFGKKGDPLPGKQFRVGKRSLFYKFWSKSGLTPPIRMSFFHDYMGNLKSIIFTGVVSNAHPERLDCSSLIPLDITCQQIKTTLETSKKTHTRHTSTPYKQSSTHNEPTALHKDVTTKVCNHSISQQEVTTTRDTPIYSRPTIRPQDQTVDEWIADYGNHESLH